MWASSVLIDLLCKECIFGAESFGEATQLTNNIVSNSTSAQNAIEYEKVCDYVDYYISKNDDFYGIFRYACKKGNFSLVKWLHETVAIDPDFGIFAFEYTDSALEIACKNGHQDIAEWLLLHFKWSREELRETFVSACMSSNLELVRWLQQEFQFNDHSDPRIVITKALQKSCNYSGNGEIVKYLFQTFHYSNDELVNGFISYGIYNKSLDTVKTIYSICLEKKVNVITATENARFQLELVSFQTLSWMMDEVPNHNPVQLFSILCLKKRGLPRAKMLYEQYQFRINFDDLFYFQILITICEKGYLESLKWIVFTFQLTQICVSKLLCYAIEYDQISCANWIVQNFGPGNINVNMLYPSLRMLQWAYQNLPGPLQPQTILDHGRCWHDVSEFFQWGVQIFGNRAFDHSSILRAFYNSKRVSTLEFLYNLTNITKLDPEKFLELSNHICLNEWKWLDTHFDLTPLRDIGFLDYYSNDAGKEMSWKQNRFQFTRHEIRQSDILYSQNNIISAEWFVRTFKLTKKDILRLTTVGRFVNISPFSRSIFHNYLPLARWYFKYFKLGCEMEKTRNHILQSFYSNETKGIVLPEPRTLRWVQKTFGIFLNES